MNITDEEIRIKVAEVMGLEIIHDPRGPIDTRPSPYSIKRKLFYTPAAAGVRRKSWPKASTVPIIPNYPADLNACAEFEKTLTDEEQASYVLFLNTQHPISDILCPDQTERGFPKKLAGEVFGLVSATACQRCIAYLKTKGILP